MCRRLVFSVRLASEVELLASRVSPLPRHVRNTYGLVELRFLVRSLLVGSESRRCHAVVSCSFDTATAKKMVGVQGCFVPL